MTPGQLSDVRLVRVTYHRDQGAWWAESDDLPGYNATAKTLEELRLLVAYGAAFYLGVEPAEVVVLEDVPGMP